MEPTLQKYVKDYIGVNRSRAKALEGNRSDEMIELPSLERIDSDKILGNEMQGVLVAFYILHEEKSDIGSKISFFSACKGIVSETISNELAPLSEHRPEKEIEAILSPMSLIARNVPDLLLVGTLNKVLIELKEKCLEELGIPSK